MIWTVIEPCIYHVAACLPTLRPLFLRLIKKDAENSKAQYGNSFAHSGKHSQDRANSYPLVGHKGISDSRFERLDDFHLEENDHSYDVLVRAQHQQDDTQRSDMEAGKKRITVTQGYTVERGV